MRCIASLALIALVAAQPPKASIVEIISNGA